MEELSTYETFAWVKNIFSDEEIEKIKQLNIVKEDARVASDTLDPVVRRSKVRWLSNIDENKWIYDRLEAAIGYANDNYFRFDLNMLEPLQLTEYDENYTGFYNKHVDVGYDRNMNRKLSFVLFLNDVSDYEGGKLQLYNATDPLVPEASKGTIVFFPSYVLHEVTPVTKGTRNTLVGWISGPRFK
jgi:PKHD-type hydroxylase